MKDANFFKVPKKLIRSEKFKNLPLSAKLIVFHLLSLHNTFQKRGEFKQKFNRLSTETGLSRSSIWRSKEGMEKIGISITRDGKSYKFDISGFYEKFIDKTSKVSK